MYGVSQSSADGSSRPNLTTIDAAFATQKDRVLVYDGGGDMAQSSNWREATDFINDTWLFDVEANGDAQLAIVFSKEGDKLVANLYDDQDGDGKVRYTLEKGYPKITESRWPTVTVVAKDGWWIDGDKINFNLDMSVDGNVLATEDTYIFIKRIKHDAIVDFEFKVRDYDSDGFPDLEWVKTFYPGSDSDHVGRAIIHGTTTKRSPTQGYGFFPFVRSQPSTLDLYTEMPAPIWIDWTAAKVAKIGEFVSSRWGGNTWFIKSFAPMEGSQPYALDFENPFGFYDLAGKNDGYPDLQVRFDQYPPNDHFYLQGRFPKSRQLVRYSWDIDHSQTWDYSLHLIGRHQIDSVVEFPDFSVKTIPYEDMPYLVTGHKWDAVNFMVPEGVPRANDERITVRENGGYWSSEGIYETGDWSDIADSYITGMADRPPVNELGQAMPPGFRVEYNYEYQRVALLYHSTIDNRLHLKGAKYGLWNIDGLTQLEYQDLDGDEYIDQWKLNGSWLDGERGTDREEILVYTGEHLIYSGKNKVSIADVQIEPYSFQTLPPRNSAEWSAFGQNLKEQGTPLSPYDLEAVFKALSLTPLVINGASVGNIQLTSKGFIGELDLHEGFSSSAPLPMSDGADPGPGRYLVAGESALTIRRALPPKLDILAPGIEIEPQVAHQKDFVDIALKIANSGTVSVENVLVSFYAEKDDRGSNLISKSFRTVLGQETIEAKATWIPSEPGDWRIKASVHYIDNSISTGASIGAEQGSLEVSKQIFVSSPEFYGWYALLDLSSGGIGPIVFLIMGVIAALSISAGIWYYATHDD